MGLPGSGKTTLSLKLVKVLTPNYLNADEVRRKFKDWDFSLPGRIRQAKRFREMADSSTQIITLADFIAPTPEVRNLYDPHFIVWMNTIKKGRFDDTNKLFVPPTNFDVKFDKWDQYSVECILQSIIKKLLRENEKNNRGIS